MFTYYDVSTATNQAVLEPRNVPRRGAVLHTTEGRNSLHWLQGGSVEAGAPPVSVDYLINRQGDIYQIGRPGFFTYHTGRARYKLMQDSDGSLNRSFCGIELECLTSAGEIVTNPQIIACAALCNALFFYHKFDLRNVVGHYEIALPPGRKQDPPSFPWFTFWVETLNPSRESHDIRFPEVLA